MDWHRMPDAAAANTRPPDGNDDAGRWARLLYRRFGNLDTLLACAYWYHVRRGFWCVCSEQLTYVLTIGFTTLYAPWLWLYVDWGQVVHCPDAGECVVFRYMGDEYTAACWCTAGLFWSMSAGFWLWNAVYCARAIRRFAAIRHMLRGDADADARPPPPCEWADVCERIASVVERELHAPELCRRLTVADVNQRITRHDAFMSAFVHAGLLDCPTAPVRFRASRLTKTLEWAIARCVFSGMVHPDGTLNTAFVRAPHRLRWRFRALGGVMAVVSPFLFVFIAIYYFLKYAEYVYKHPIYIATRRWSPYARLRLRVPGELPHLTSQRVALAYRDVDLFIGKHPQHLPCIWGRLLSFVLGSFVGTILAMGVLSERALLARFGGEHDLLWLLAVLSALILLVRSSTETARASPEAVEVDVATLQSRMIHVPRAWHTCPSDRVAADLQRLCPPVALFFVHELVGILTTPLHLYFSFASRAADIVGFVEAQSVHVENVGVVFRPNGDGWERA
jgi:autophagy-related protein 9